MNNMGSRLRDVRKKRGMTQKALATRICKCTSAVSGYENDDQIPPVDVLVSIARLFDVSVDYLVGLENERTYSTSELNEAQIELLDALLSEFHSPSSNGKQLSARQIEILQRLFDIFAKR